MKSYFGFTRSQQLGILIWSLLLVILFFARNIFTNYPETSVIELSQSDIQYVQFNAKEKINEQQNIFLENMPENHTSLFSFDPNNIELNDWKNLGFSDKQGQAIINYRTKFGPFKKKEDLKKIFVVSAEKYNELEPYIVIEGAIENKTVSSKIELNKATTDELETLPGIGPKYAERILKFRNSLGGFYEMSQLHEVYNMSEDVYQILVDNTSLNSNEINRIKINSASKDEIDKHPYIDFDVTAAILKEREINKLTDLEFLVEKNLITTEEKKRIEPYIIFE